MTGFGPFNTPILNVQAALEPGQRARAASVLVARQARPGCPLSELLTLAQYIHRGDVPEPDQPRVRNPYELFADRPAETGMISTDPGPVAMNGDDPWDGLSREEMAADPSAFGRIRRSAFTVGEDGPDDEGDGLG